MKTYYLISLWSSGAIAVLSLIALPLWLMGVPGTENSYAQGWRIGLKVVLIYPVVWFGLFGFSHILMKKAVAFESLYLWFGSLWAALLLLACAAIFYAFRIMARR